MSEEKIIDNGEINDDVLEDVSGGRTVFFDCNKCKTSLRWYLSGNIPEQEVTCFICQSKYIVVPYKYEVTQKGTDKGVSGLRWA